MAGQNDMSKVPEYITFKEREALYLVWNVLGCMHSCVSVCAFVQTCTHMPIYDH